MKNLFIAIAMLTLLASCITPAKDSYDMVEIECLKIAGKAKPYKDSMTIIHNYKEIKLPVYNIDENQYYPGESKGAGIRYYLFQ